MHRTCTPPTVRRGDRSPSRSAPRPSLSTWSQASACPWIWSLLWWKGSWASGSRMALRVGVEKPTPRHMGVALSGGEAGVSQELLHSPYIGTALQQVSGERMAQRVGAHLAPRQHPPGVAFDHGPDVAGHHPLLPTIEEQRLLGDILVREEGPPAAFQILPHGGGGEVAQGDGALLAALPHDPDPPAVDVDVLQAETAQLGNPKARAVQKLQDGPITEGHRVRPSRRRGQGLRVARLQDHGE